jgi:hypothetical protein
MVTDDPATDARIGRRDVYVRTCCGQRIGGEVDGNPSRDASATLLRSCAVGQYEEYRHPRATTWCRPGASVHVHTDLPYGIEAVVCLETTPCEGRYRELLAPAPSAAAVLLLRLSLPAAACRPRPVLLRLIGLLFLAIDLPHVDTLIVIA